MVVCSGIYTHPQYGRAFFLEGRAGQEGNTKSKSKGVYVHNRIASVLEIERVEDREENTIEH